MSGLAIGVKYHKRHRPRRWAQYGLLVFLILLIYDGALRKWLLPGSETLLFVAKDALLLVLLAYSLVHEAPIKGIRLQPMARVLLAAYVGWALVESANPALPNLLVGLWGLKAHVLYAGLILLVPLAFGSLRALFRWLTRAYPWLVIPVCLLAFVQLASPLDSFVNQSLRGGIEELPTFGEEGLVRVSGSFSYTSGMSVFTQAAAQLGLGVLLCVGRSAWFLVGLSVTALVLPATGARAVIVTTAGSLVSMFALAAISGLVQIRTALQYTVVVAALVGISLASQDRVWIALGQRAFTDAEMAADSGRALTAVTNAVDYFDVAGWIGFGSGAANLGSPALAKKVEPFSWLPVGGAFEEESGRLVLELGIVGWVLSLALRISLLLWAVRLARRGATQEARAAGVMALPCMLLGVHGGTGVFAPPIGASVYWFSVSLMAMAEQESANADMRQMERGAVERLGYAA